LIEVIFSALLVSVVLLGAVSLLLMNNRVFQDGSAALTVHDQARNAELFLHDPLAKASTIVLDNALSPAAANQRIISFQLQSTGSLKGLTVYQDGAVLATFANITGFSLSGSSEGARCTLQYVITAQSGSATAYALKGSAVLNNFTGLPTGISAIPHDFSAGEYLNLAANIS